MDCPSCGRSISAEVTQCAHCGHSLVLSSKPTPPDNARRESSSEADELEELLHRRPSAIGAGGRLVMMLVFGLMFLGLVVFFFIVSTKRGDSPPIFQILFGIFGLGSLALALAGVRGLVRLTRSPLLRLPAVVVGKREKVPTSRYSDPVIYFLTVKTEEGKAKEHTVSESLFTQVKEGDAGVAYLKGGYLLDFKPVHVPQAPADPRRVDDT